MPELALSWTLLAPGGTIAHAQDSAAFGNAAETPTAAVQPASTPPPSPSASAEPAPTPVATLQWEWFPATPPTLAPYLSNLNLLGSNCLQPALVESDPLSSAAQWVKERLASVGLTYRLDQSYVFAAMSNVTRGDNVLNFYNLQFIGNWVVFNTTDLGGSSGWVAMEAIAATGLGIDAAQQSPHQNIGSATWPDYSWTGNSLYISELAWSQSFFGGHLIVQAGMLDQTLYLDANAYANNQYTQFMNWAFVNSQVLPFSFGSLGAIIQWQPCNEFYAMAAWGANNAIAGRPPWHGVNSDNWSLIGELGFISEDTLGLGRGIYRVQPFWATYQGAEGGGICLNFEQQLGHESKLGMFGRLGVGSDDVTLVGGAASQVAVGLAVLGPNIAGLQRTASDFLAAGFVWTQPPARTATHSNEFGLEITYNFQVTPTMTLQPDIQVIWDPAYGAANTSVIFQIQLAMSW